MVRLDKFLTNNTSLSRSMAVKAIKEGRVVVLGENKITKDTKIDEQSSEVFLDGNRVVYNKYIYIMLNKPSGVVSATNDTKEKTVLDLLPQELKKFNLFPCGRLDKDTVGLVILTNNGIGAHNVLSPKKHVKKIYKYECADPLTQENELLIENGIKLADGYVTKPCEIEKISQTQGKIALTEGKYHEIKRMFGAVGNKITKLERISFGFINLDSSLKRGEFRYLTNDEIKLFEQE